MPGNARPDRAVEASLDAAPHQEALVHEITRPAPITRRSMERLLAGAYPRMAVSPITKQEPDSPHRESLAAAKKAVTGAHGEGSSIDHEAGGIIDLTSDGEEESDKARARADGDRSEDPVGCIEQPMLPGSQAHAGKPPSQQGTAAQCTRQPHAVDLGVGSSDRQRQSQHLDGQALLNKALQYRRNAQAARGAQKHQLRAPSGPVTSQAAEPLLRKLDPQVTPEDLTCKESLLPAPQGLPAPASGSSGRSDSEATSSRQPSATHAAVAHSGMIPTASQEQPSLLIQENDGCSHRHQQAQNPPMPSLPGPPQAKMPAGGRDDCSKPFPPPSSTAAASEPNSLPPGLQQDLPVDLLTALRAAQQVGMRVRMEPQSDGKYVFVFV